MGPVLGDRHPKRLGSFPLFTVPDPLVDVVRRQGGNCAQSSASTYRRSQLSLGNLLPPGRGPRSAPRWGAPGDTPASHHQHQGGSQLQLLLLNALFDCQASQDPAIGS